MTQSHRLFFDLFDTITSIIFNSVLQQLCQVKRQSNLISIDNKNENVEKKNNDANANENNFVQNDEFFQNKKLFVQI